MALNAHHGRRGFRDGEDGYILLGLLLIVALMIIMAAVMLPSITFEIRRDREEEMIHRGVQYSRAIRAYYKKFGRYPVKIEDLESSNNMRFLRKRYKDPMNCKNSKCEDFKLLHFGDVKLTFGGAMGGGTIPGATAVGSPIGANGPTGPGGLGQTSTFGTNTMGSNTLGGTSAPGTNPTPPAGTTQQNGTNPAPGTDATDPTAQVSGAPGSSNSGTTSPGTNTSDTGSPGSGPVIGGGPIVGVVSASKKETIREFNHKRKYDEWQFIYDPGTDRGGLLMTPNQPPLLGAIQQGMPGTAPGTPGVGTGITPGQNNQNPQGTTDQNQQNPQNPQNPTNSPVGPGNYYQQN